ncbi:MAG: hypothetical protein ACPL06_04515 [Candidatus Anstonellales archaeon]
MAEDKPPQKTEAQKQHEPGKEKEATQNQPAVGMPNPRKISSIVIALDDYNDIFSDFDMSPYQQRLLSDDFLKEIQKRYLESKKGDIEVKFSLPATLRDQKLEGVIKKRLREYFNFQLKESDNEIYKRRISGAVYIVVGFFLLAIEYGLTEGSFSEAIPRALGILLLPAGWFSMWNGLELLIQIPEKITEQRKLYSKFAKANYTFISEEELEEMEKKEEEQIKQKWVEQTRLEIFP